MYLSKVFKSIRDKIDLKHTLHPDFRILDINRNFYKVEENAIFNPPLGYIKRSYVEYCCLCSFIWKVFYIINKHFNSF